MELSPAPGVYTVESVADILQLLRDLPRLEPGGPLYEGSLLAGCWVRFPIDHDIPLGFLSQEVDDHSHELTPKTEGNGYTFKS
jgi:hypothetical protein